MTLIDLLVILIFLVLVAVSKVGLSVLTVLFLVVALIIERVLFGERFPVRKTTP